MLDRLFLAHPRSVGESYFGHMRTAASFGTRMIVAGAACTVHALLPTLFPKTASTTVRTLYREMQVRGAPEAPAPVFRPEYEI